LAATVRKEGIGSRFDPALLGQRDIELGSGRRGLGIGEDWLRRANNRDQQCEADDHLHRTTQPLT